MHRYRTHNAGQLRRDDVGQVARLSGWVHRKRDHGQLVFVDLRDNDGVTQCVVNASSPSFAAAAALRLESVVTMTGRVVARGPESVNLKLPTGEIELAVDEPDAVLAMLTPHLGTDIEIIGLYKQAAYAARRFELAAELTSRRSRAEERV